MSEGDRGNAHRPETSEIEQVKTLWILACHIEGCHTHQLVPLYAISEQDAEQQAQQWLTKQAYEMVRLSLRSFPGGFVMCRERLPGIIGYTR